MIDAATATILVALIGAVAAIYGHNARRVSERMDDLDALVAAARAEADKARADVDRARAYNAKLWAYNRELLDLYYRHRTPDAPNPNPLPEED